MILRKIKKHLISTINIDFIEIYDHSHYHKYSKTDLTHIKIVIVSNDFINKKSVDRHRMIFAQLLNIKKIYSLTLDTYTLNEWKNKKYKIKDVCQCLKRK